MNRIVRLAVLALCLGVGACAETLPPHVWMPVASVEGVDFFWWTGPPAVCQVRVIWWQTPDQVNSQTLTVDPAECLDHLKARGYDVAEQKSQLTEQAPK